ncbi:hypothetical protein MRX96_058616 [Rhipicephalus microplus]
MKQHAGYNKKRSMTYEPWDVVLVGKELRQVPLNAVLTAHLRHFRREIHGEPFPLRQLARTFAPWGGSLALVCSRARMEYKRALPRSLAKSREILLIRSVVCDEGALRPLQRADWLERTQP